MIPANARSPRKSYQSVSRLRLASPSNRAYLLESATTLFYVSGGRSRSCPPDLEDNGSCSVAPYNVRKWIRPIYLVGTNRNCNSYVFTVPWTLHSYLLYRLCPCRADWIRNSQELQHTRDSCVRSDRRRNSDPRTGCIFYRRPFVRTAPNCIHNPLSLSPKNQTEPHSGAHLTTRPINLLIQGRIRWVIERLINIATSPLRPKFSGVQLDSLTGSSVFCHSAWRECILPALTQSHSSR